MHLIIETADVNQAGFAVANGLGEVEACGIAVIAVVPEVDAG